MIRIACIACFLLFSASLSAQHVFYGERVADSTKLALYFDKDGFPYPDYYIPNSTMEKAGGSLFAWFMQNSDAFISISAQHQLFPEKIDSETIYRLRDSITAVQLRRINNELNKGWPAVAYYIHGFRKSYLPQNGDVTSQDEFQLLKTNLTSYSGVPNALAIEVYWDGMYDCCFSTKRKKNRELFRLFEQAGNNAMVVGLGLRSFLNGTKTTHLQIVAHSLGAVVATSALFNIGGRTGPTPAQRRVSVCFIAPAMGNDLLLDNYLKHNGFTVNNQPFSDNYRLLIIYNEKDFVLRKKDPKIGWFGPGTKRYGNTSLGCNHRKAAVQLQQQLKEQGVELKLLDKTSLGKVHSLRFYAKDQNLKEMSDFLWGI